MNKWEEKNYIKQKSNCLNSNGQEPSDITTSTKRDSMKPQWKDIGGVKKWIRNCPKCGDEIQTKNKPLHTETTGLCRSCAHKDQPRSKKKYTIDELSRTCPRCGNKILHTTLKNCNQAKKKNIICRSCKDSAQMIGEYRECMHCKNKFYASVGQSKLGWATFCSVACKAQHFKDHQRNKMIENLKHKHGQISPNYNIKGCKIIEDLGNKLGYKFQHAQNGGEYFIKELGYWVDGYDKENNVIIEYDEPSHYDRWGKLKQKDIDRMNKIIQHTNCKFYRYNEKLNEVTQYN